MIKKKRNLCEDHRFIQNKIPKQIFFGQTVHFRRHFCVFNARYNISSLYHFLEYYNIYNTEFVYAGINIS